jgi:hypothetical protein
VEQGKKGQATILGKLERMERTHHNPGTSYNPGTQTQGKEKNSYNHRTETQGIFFNTGGTIY